MDAVLRIAGLLQFTHLPHARANFRRGFRRAALADFLHGHSVYLHLNVDAVKQRAGDAVEVAADILRGAAAFLRLAAIKSARAGVHAGNHHEAGLVLRLIVDARHTDDAVLQRLAQRFQGVAAELRQFIQEQHAVVRQRYFTRLCI